MTVFLKKLTSSLGPLVGGESLAWLEQHSDGEKLLEARVATRLNLREARRQKNLEAIFALAAEELQEEVSDDPVFEDWLALYVDLAGDVADATAQQVWARLLALQIAVPDAVFKRTLLHLHSMDLWELNAFAEFCSFAFAFESGWRFVFEENITRPETWGYTRGNDYTQHFINTGLLSPEVSRLRMGLSKGGMRIRYYEKEYGLAPDSTESTSGLAFPDAEFGYRRFTVTGQQLTKALRAQTYYGYARNVISRLATEHKVEFQWLDEEGGGTTGDET
jgi:hypothetical protein